MRPPFLSRKEGAIRKTGTYTLALVGIYLLTSRWAATVGSSCIQWAADTCSPCFPRGSQEPGIQGQLKQPWAISLHSPWLTSSGVTRTCPALWGARDGGNKADPGNLGRALVVPAVTAILFPSAPLATTELGLEKLFVKRNYRKMTRLYFTGIHRPIGTLTLLIFPIDRFLFRMQREQSCINVWMQISWDSLTSCSWNSNAILE